MKSILLSRLNESVFEFLLILEGILQHLIENQGTVRTGISQKETFQ
mgnify:CR=1